MNGLLICTGEGKNKNIGDFIQSVAQEQFFEKIDCYVEREHLDTFQANEKVNVIMNAWFMWHPENFPPSDVINPLFISFHLVPKIADSFFTTQTILYLRKYEPIGARDLSTKHLLEQHGIKSYFSGCLTLTLGLKYESAKHDGNYFFVDPFYNIIGAEEGFGRVHKFMKILCVTCRHFKLLRLLKNKFHAEYNAGPYKFSKKISDWICCVSFYNTYSKYFDDDILLHANYLTHDLPQSQFKDNDDKMQYARDLIKTYAKARLVITSRLHCALPCLATGTPTIFVNSDKLEKGFSRSGSSGRFMGLIELLNTVYCKKQELCANDEYMTNILHNKIKRDTIINNPSNYLKIKDNLISNVTVWIKEHLSK